MQMHMQRFRTTHSASKVSRRIETLACLWVLTVGTVPSADAREESLLVPAGFDDYVAEVMSDWNVPGVGVAISRAGDSLERSFGVREAHRPAPVDGDTMFMVASVSKTFTAAAVAVLVDQGKIAWDDPVQRHLPQLALGDPWVSANVTIRDLLGMRSGIATDGDWLEEVPFATSKTLLKRAKYLGQARPFRSGFEYNNYNYTILGELIERVSGLTWNAFVKKHLLEPLGLRNTQPTAQDFIPVEHLAPGGEVALPRGPVGYGALVAPFQNVVARHAMHPAFSRSLAAHADELHNTIAPYARFSVDPSTSVFSSTHDLHRWARMWRGLGEVDGVRVVSEKAMSEMRRYQSLGQDETFEPYSAPAKRIAARKLAQFGYGLGLQLGRYGEQAYAGHSGGDIGAGAHLYVFPETGTAIVVLTNNSLYGGGSYAASAILYRVLDHLFGYPQKDWNGQLKQLYMERQTRSRDADMLRGAAARSQRRMSIAPVGYAGLYSDGGHRGAVQIRLKEGAMQLIVCPELEAAAVDPVMQGHLLWARQLPPARIADLTHWGGDTFQIRWRGPRRTAELITFTIEGGRATSLDLPQDTRGGPAKLRRIDP